MFISSGVAKEGACAEERPGHVQGMGHVGEEMRHFVIYNLEQQRGCQHVYFGFIGHQKSNLYKPL